ncbi:Spy/CpxP family protein refolding chaperone [Bdellovibrio sp. HCB337]|uniref:Spy/CpxP family protein refolding chaperone n=1 Tax=Bdellovibrio sp. HCB337 TaxID=3394358 RepID=UPI0039A752D1
MRHTHRRKWPRILGMLLALGGIGVIAAGCNRSPEEKMTAISEKIADKLDFNDQQKGLLGDITNELKKDFAEEKSIRNAKKEEFKNMLLSDDLDKTKIKTLIKERQARMDSKVDKYLDKVAALHKTLTPEQKKEILDKVEKFHRWHE